MAGKGDDWDWYKKKLDAFAEEMSESIITFENMCEFNAKESMHGAMRSEWRKHLEDKSHQYEDRFDDWAKHIEQARAIDKEPGFESYLRPFWIKPRPNSQLPLGKEHMNTKKVISSRVSSSYLANLVEPYQGKALPDHHAIPRTPKSIGWVEWYSKAIPRIAEYDYAKFKEVWLLLISWVHEYNNRLLWVLESDEFFDMEGGIYGERPGGEDRENITQVRIKSCKDDAMRVALARDTMKMMNIKYPMVDGALFRLSPASPHGDSCMNFIYWCNKNYMTMSMHLGVCIPFDEKEMEQNSNLEEGWELHRSFRGTNLSFPNLSPEDGIRKCLDVLEDIRQGIQDDKLENEIEKWHMDYVNARDIQVEEEERAVRIRYASEKPGHDIKISEDGKHFYKPKPILPGQIRGD